MSSFLRPKAGHAAETLAMFPAPPTPVRKSRINLEAPSKNKKEKERQISNIHQLPTP